MTESEAYSWLEQEFERCWPWIKDALDTEPYETHRKEDIWSYLQKGELQLWPGPNSVAVTEVNTYPSGSKVLTVLMAGGDLAELKITNLTLSRYGKEAGCTHMSIRGRPGWERALEGYRRTGVMLSKEL